MIWTWTWTECIVLEEDYIDQHNRLDISYSIPLNPLYEYIQLCMCAMRLYVLKAGTVRSLRNIITLYWRKAYKHG